MANAHIIIVESDAQHRRLLEVSLIKEGYAVDVSENIQNARAALSVRRPDLIISNTKLSDGSGLEFCQEVRRTEILKDVPFVILTEDASVGTKVQSLQMGADDYLVRPIYLRELSARLELLLAKAHRTSTATESIEKPMRGELYNISIIELLQQLHRDRRNATIEVESSRGRGQIWVNQGNPIDAVSSSVHGEAALFRMMGWDEGRFTVEYKRVERLVAIHRPVTVLIDESLNQTEEWNQLAQQLPDLGSGCSVNYGQLAENLAQLPDSHTTLVRLVDKGTTMQDLIERSDLPDLYALRVLSELFFEGIIELSARSEDLSTQGYTEPKSDLNLASPVDELMAAVEDRKPSQSEASPRPSSTKHETKATTPSTAKAERATVSVPTSEPTPVEVSAPPTEPPHAESDPVQSATSSDENAWDDAVSFWDLKESTADAKDAEAETLSNDTGPEFEEMVGSSISDEVSEDEFFSDAQQNMGYEDVEDESDDDDEFNVPPGKSMYVALGLFVMIGIVCVFMFTQDSVEPVEYDNRALNDNWAERAAREQPAMAKSIPLDASWNIPTLPDGGLLPAAPGIVDTFANSRKRKDQEDLARENSSQEAMKLLDTDSANGPAVEAGNTTTPAQRKEALKLGRLGAKALNSESFDAAKGLFEKSLALDPTNVNVLRMHTQVLVEVNEMEEAIEFGLKSIRLGIKSADAMQVYLLLGQSYQSLNRVKEARAAYENYLKLAESVKSTEVRNTVPGIKQLLTRLVQKGQQREDSSN